MQVITRHGDRAPCNVLPHEVNITWFCDDPDPYDTANTPIKPLHVRDEPAALRPATLWQSGNCAVCDLTGRGLVQHYMLGEALGAIYSQFMAIGPETMYVRSTDEARTRQSAEALVRGALTVATDTGIVHLHTPVAQSADIMRPQPSSCPALAAAMSSVRSSQQWKENIEQHKALMTTLTDMLGTHALEWTDSFDHLFDNLHARACHGLPLPCHYAGADAAVGAEYR